MSSALSSSARAILRARPVRSTLPYLSFSRTYFSQHHSDPAPFPPVQDTILSAALKRVPEHGFTNQALTLGAKDAGYLDVSVQLFPRGVFDLILYHLVSQRLALKKNVQFPEDVKLGVGRKVKTLTMTRLRANKDIIHQWQGALGHMSLLGNIPAVAERTQCSFRRGLVSRRRYHGRLLPGIPSERLSQPSMPALNFS